MDFSLLNSYISKSDEGYLYESVWTEYAIDLFTQVFLYLAIALVVICLPWELR